MSDIQRAPFPPVIDSTLLSAYRSCGVQAERTYLQHYKPKQQSVHLVAGAAFAAGLERARTLYYIDGATLESSVAMGLNKLIISYGDFEPEFNTSKTLDRVAGAYEFFMQVYPMDDDSFIPLELADGKRGIEFSFAEPLDILHPTTKNPLIFAGRADMIGTFADGLFLEDDKTTTSLGASWQGNWEMRGQFTGYMWAAYKAGLRAVGTLIRGVSILKTKYDTQQVITYRSPMEIQRWEDQLYKDLRRMIQDWESGLWDYNLDNACTSYGGCPYVQVCKSNNPEIWLNNDFERRVWDPLGRQEISVEEWQKIWSLY